MLCLEDLEIKTAKACFHLFGDILLDEKACTYYTAEPGTLPLLQKYLVHGAAELKCCVLWIITNILCNSQTEVELIVKSGIFGNVSLAARCNDLEIRKEAIWAVSTLCSKNTGHLDLQPFELD